jgi:ABC-2 type transport system permease protein
MFDEGKLWKDRFAQFSKELGRYLRYIFNGHLVVVLLFLLGTVAYNYQIYVKYLKPDFPAAPIMAIVIGVFLTHSPIYTFLLEADKIFLLPLESKLNSYFKKSMVVSFIFQLYVLLMLLALFMPVYVQVYQGNFKSFFTFLLVIAVMKVWNLLSRWQVQYLVDSRFHLFDSLSRYVLNVLFLYFMFLNDILYMAIAMVMIIVLFVYWRTRTKESGLKWEHLIDLEEKRMTSFYRIANLFTDVPKLKDRVKRRRWLDWIFGVISFGKENTYLFLYMRAFVRAGDYLGLVIRLTVIGGIALYYFVSFGIGQLLVVLIFLYLTGFQLLPLANHHQNKIWVSLYPIEDQWKDKTFQKLLFRILLVQSVLLALVLIIKGVYAIGAIALVLGVVFSFYFVFSYSSKRLKRI